MPDRPVAVGSGVVSSIAASIDESVQIVDFDFGHFCTTPRPSKTVLGAAGHRVPRRREGPAGLTRREVEVLLLLARGLSNKEIAECLVITPKTVGNHAERIYAKLNVSTRAGAALFAMRHGLLPEETFPARVAA
jgi:DNA-binding NarL/FixJ family response regulator